MPWTPKVPHHQLAHSGLGDEGLWGTWNSTWRVVSKESESRKTLQFILNQKRWENAGMLDTKTRGFEGAFMKLLFGIMQVASCCLDITLVGDNDHNIDSNINIGWTIGLTFLIENSLVATSVSHFPVGFDRILIHVSYSARCVWAENSQCGKRQLCPSNMGINDDKWISGREEMMNFYVGTVTHR